MAGQRVRLNRKFAQVIDGVDLSHVRPGDEIEVSARAAFLLIAEGWADPVATPVNDQAGARDRASRRKRTSKTPSR